MAEALLYSRLSDVLATLLGSIVGGEFEYTEFEASDFEVGTFEVRVYPVSGCQDAVRPFVAYELDSNTPEWCLDGEAGPNTYSFAVTVFGTHYDQCGEVVDLITAGLDDFSSDDVRAMFCEGQRGQSDADGYGVELTYKVVS